MSMSRGVDSYEDIYNEEGNNVLLSHSAVSPSMQNYTRTM